MPVNFEPVWAYEGDVRLPSQNELRFGFQCGEADPALFNYLFQEIHTIINGLDGQAPLPATRAVRTGTGLVGGGGLDIDRTISLALNSLDTETAIANDDYIVIYDRSASAHRKMTRDAFVAGLGGGGGGLTSGSNIGGAAGEFFSAIDTNTLQFRTLSVGSGLSVVTTGDVVTVSYADMPAALTVE